jgi:hypothetical protein
MRSRPTVYGCALLHLSGDAGDWRSDLVATKIIELAAAGEHDASRLTTRMLAEFGVDNDGTLLPHGSVTMWSI